MSTGALLAGQLAETRRWLNLLLADFAGDNWTYQPAPGVQHALWICGHLASSQNTLLFQRCLGRDELDASFCRHFTPGSPVQSAAQYDWPDADTVLAIMADMHEKTLGAVRGLSDVLLAEPAFGKNGTKHPHYDTKLGAISHLDRHEAFHAGQVAMLRRLLGKGFLR